MENSQAYIGLINQLKATGRKKLDGYYPLTLENIYDWERDEVEDIIWKNFVDRNEIGLAQFLPKLKKYNGIEALKTKLNFCIVPSGNSVDIAEALYNATEEKKYLDILKENYRLSNNKMVVVSRLSHLADKSEVYSFLVDVYINDSDSVIRTCAIEGILCAKGYIQDIDDIKEFMKKKDFIKMFRTENIDSRRNMIKELKSGSFENYKQ